MEPPERVSVSQPPDGDGTAAPPAPNMLTVVDSRTGRVFEVAIDESNVVRAADLSRSSGPSAKERLILYDPGFTNTAACRSSITYIDGEKGILQHRGYAIEALCRHSTFLELAYLLIYGELPTPQQRDTWGHEIATRKFVHENVKAFLEGFRYDAHPMAMLEASVGALSSFYADADDVYDEQARGRQIARVLAKLPTLAAFSYRHLKGLRYIYPEDDLSYAGNLLSMMFRMSELKYQVDPRAERALDVMLMLHADHEQNASTTAVRAVGSTHVNPYSAVAAGVAAPSGPMRGAAEQATVTMLRRIGRTENVAGFLDSVKQGQQRLMGFGHWVYKTYDPRARILRAQLDGLYEARPVSPLLVIADELARQAAEDPYFTSRALYPNVDLYSGLTYEALGISPEMFPVMFALARSAGWVAQWLEMVKDPEQMAVRPLQLYSGVRDREFVPVDQRR
jgi:citrate synthase